MAVQMACRWIEDQVRHGFLEQFSEKLQLLGKFNRTIVGQNLVRCVMSMQEGTQSRKVGCNAVDTEERAMVADAASDIVVRIKVGNSGDEVEKGVSSQSGVKNARHLRMCEAFPYIPIARDITTQRRT